VSARICPRCRFLNLDGSSACMACGHPAPAAASGAGRNSPSDEEEAFWRFDLNPSATGTVGPAPEVPTASTARPGPEAGPTGTTSAMPGRDRATQRARVRRLVMSGSAASRTRVDVPPRVLVLQSDEGTRMHLRSLLEAFGFLDLLADLEEVKSRWPEMRHAFVAAFVDIRIRSADGGDGIDLCRALREAGEAPSGPQPALMLTAEALAPADRVRASLAGCSDLILGPINRGKVAGALVRQGIALPSDSRRPA
jgi:CheY-like chemotaxis protein